MPSFRLALALLCLAACLVPMPAHAAPSGPPLASGHGKFLGSVSSPSQSVNFTAYFNQVTPENSGKWGSVESTRDVMNWTELDAAYALAKTNGFPFRLHVLIWGNQQPTWIETLSAADQLAEIEEWFSAVAARYPEIDYMDVVNEPLHAPPDQAGHGNYLNALGGSGASGWDWVLTAFRLARKHFPATTRLMLNEYNVTNNTADMQRYIGIINLLKAERLIDAVGVQGHAFSTRVPAATTKANLDLLATTALPIIVTEFDIDGATDQIQLDDYQRIFPVFWEHPAVIGITLWGYRPGLWRNTEGAYLVLDDGTERPAMTWLRTYLANHRPVIAADQNFYVSDGAANGANVGTVGAADPDGGGTLRSWAIVGGTGAGTFTINSSTGQLTVANRSALNAAASTLILSVSDGRDTSETQTVTVHVYPAGQPSTRFVNISARGYCSTVDRVMIGGFVVNGTEAKRVLVRAVGPTLTTQQIGEAEVLLDPQIEVHRGVPVIAFNDNWTSNADADEITSVGSQIGANPLASTDTKSSAMLLTLQPGVYSFVASGKAGTSGIVLLEVYDADAPTAASTFVNISTRAYATTGNGVTIGGFVVGGSVPKQVLLRAVGPTLTTQGISQTDVLLDPVIELHQGAPVIARNDNWRDNANVEAITTVGARIGAAPFALTDTTSSALLLTLNPGVYSFIASGKSSTSGIVLVEVYDAD